MCRRRFVAPEARRASPTPAVLTCCDYHCRRRNQVQGNGLASAAMGRAVRIDQQQAIAARHILADDRAQQGRLAHAGLAQHGDLAQAFMQREGNGIAGGIGSKSGVFHIRVSTGERSDAPGRRRPMWGLL